MLHHEGTRLKRVIVCPPGEDFFNVADLASQGMNAAPDREKTFQQYNTLIETMVQSGADVIEATALAGHPNSVFPRDVAVATPEGYIKMRMGLDARRDEADWMASFLDSLQEPCAGIIEPPGTVEGGDVILAGSVAFVGQSSRTNAEGVRQISEILSRLDYEVRSVEVRNTSLHIGGLMSAIARDRVLCCPDAFPYNFFEGFDTIPISCQGPSHGNVICMAENEVIANVSENQDGIDILEMHDVKVHALDLSEYRKGGGGPTCLILPLERG